MISVKCIVNGQQLKRITTPFLIRDSKNYVLLDFSFSKDWNGCKKTAIFNGKYEKELTSDVVIVPASCLTSPDFTVSVYGELDDMLITTNKVTVELGASGYVPDADVPEDATDEEYKKLIAELQKEVADLETSNSELTASNETLQTEKASLEADNAELTANNEALQGENAHLESELEELQASIKPEQEKSVDITENGTTEITPDENKTLSRVTVKVNVPSSGGTEELESLIDQSKVLDSTDGTATEKVEQLIEKVGLLNFYTNELEGITMVRNEGYCIAETPVIDCSNYTTLSSAFANTYHTQGGAYNYVGLEVIRLKNTHNVRDWVRVFLNARAVHTIETLDLSSATDTSVNYTSEMFTSCYGLVNVKFVPETIKASIQLPHSTKLSAESIQSIIGGLATVETAKTLTLHTDVVAKLTDEQALTIMNKNWSVT